MTTVSSLSQRRFNDLYEEHRLAVLAYCTRRLGRDDATDACSETFLVAWRRLDEVPPAPETLPYLYGVASRVVSNHVRSLRRRGRLDARLASLGVAVAPDPAIHVVQGGRDLEVVAAVRRLSPRDREIVMLYAWEDLPRDTIAEMMGMSRSAIDQRIHRANRKLARMLEPGGSKNPSPIAQEGGT